jgi:hypothetical protein
LLAPHFPLTFSQPHQIADIGREQEAEQLVVPRYFAELTHISGRKTRGRLGCGCVIIEDRNGDPTSLLLSERAQYFARRNGLNFGEALNQVSQMSWDAPASTAAQTITPELRQAEKESSDRAITSGALSPELAAMAWQTARSENVTFKQALCRAAAEHPEIVASWVADGLYRQEHPLGSGR